VKRSRLSQNEIREQRKALGLGEHRCDSATVIGAQVDAAERVKMKHAGREEPDFQRVVQLTLAATPG
jgi:hypothetical protein